MPGNIQTSTPTTVLPKGLCTGFTLVLDFPVAVNIYKSGEYQAALLVDNARRMWQLTRKLPSAGSDELAAFYLARGGAAQAFWFYDPFEAAGDAGSNWDSTGTVTNGRYCVRFDGGMGQQQARPGRQDSSFTLKEIA